jgi:hypothetical protein
MVVTFTDEAMARIDTMRRETVSRLASRATHFTVERDTVRPGSWVVRNPYVPYRIFLVNQRGQCNCRQYQLWDRCKHSALVECRMITGGGTS